MVISFWFPTLVHVRGREAARWTTSCGRGGCYAVRRMLCLTSEKEIHVHIGTQLHQQTSKSYDVKGRALSHRSVGLSFPLRSGPLFKAHWLISLADVRLGYGLRGDVEIWGRVALFASTLCPATNPGPGWCETNPIFSNGCQCKYLVSCVQCPVGCRQR